MATIQDQLALVRAVAFPTLTIASGNLFQIAGEKLGDPTQWNRIAELNGLTDPWISGLVTLRLPPVDASAGNGGILGV